MHAQTHMSGQISGQIPNQLGPQMSSIAPNSTSSLASQMQNFTAFRSSWNMDPNFEMSRTYIREKM